MDENIKFLKELDAEVLKAELFVFLENDEIDTNLDITEQFVNFIKEDLSRADG